MPYGVVCYFDIENENHIKALWKQLYDAGFDTFMATSGMRPHVTLGVFENIPEEEAGERLRQFTSDVTTFNLQFPMIGSFATGEGTIILVPAVTKQLLSLHEKFYQYFKDYYIKGKWDYYLPEAWVPHCTIGINIPKEKLPEAFGMVHKGYQPMSAKVVEICLEEFYPVRTVAECKLRVNP